MVLDTGSIADYERFLKIKALPQYRFEGTTAVFPDEYAASIGIGGKAKKSKRYKPAPWLFDYQRAIVERAVTKKCFSAFADCGLGKTLILLEFARHAHEERGGRVLIVSPLMVVQQTIDQAEEFYKGKYAIQRLPSQELAEWLRTGTGIGITNYDAITDDLPITPLTGLILDESSMLKSHYGAWGTRLIQMGRGVEYKMCLTGTPAPNDRIEYANHAVFMDAYPTVNSFLARFFVNRGETGEIRVLVTKPKILGFGLNLQIATRQVFSTLQDSYEEFYQAVKRSNRYGSTKPLNVHIPLTELEAPMVATVMAKANRVHSDTVEQERIFREYTDLTGTPLSV